MMEKYIKGILLLGGEKPKVIKVENTLNSLCKLLNCCLVEIIKRKTHSDFNSSNLGVDITIICDEEGLLKGREIAPSGFLFDEEEGTFKEVLLGTIFICDTDKEGNLISLSEEKIEKVIESIRETKFGDVDYIEDGFGNTLLPSDSALIYSAW